MPIDYPVVGAGPVGMCSLRGTVEAVLLTLTLTLNPEPLA